MHLDQENWAIPGQVEESCPHPTASVFTGIWGLELPSEEYRARIQSTYLVHSADIHRDIGAW